MLFSLRLLAFYNIRARAGHAIKKCISMAGECSDNKCERPALVNCGGQRLEPSSTIARGGVNASLSRISGSAVTGAPQTCWAFNPATIPTAVFNFTVLIIRGTGCRIFAEAII